MFLATLGPVCLFVFLMKSPRISLIFETSVLGKPFVTGVQMKEKGDLTVINK